MASRWQRNTNCAKKCHNSNFRNTKQPRRHTYIPNSKLGILQRSKWQTPPETGGGKCDNAMSSPSLNVQLMDLENMFKSISLFIFLSFLSFFSRDKRRDTDSFGVESSQVQISSRNKTKSHVTHCPGNACLRQPGNVFLRQRLMLVTFRFFCMNEMYLSEKEGRIIIHFISRWSKRENVWACNLELRASIPHAPGTHLLVYPCFAQMYSTNLMHTFADAAWEGKCA